MESVTTDRDIAGGETGWFHERWFGFHERWFGFHETFGPYGTPRGRLLAVSAQAGQCGLGTGYVVHAHRVDAGQRQRQRLGRAWRPGHHL